MTDRTRLLWLQVGVSVTLLARGWLTIRWDSPIRTLAWQENWWSGPIERLGGGSWSEFAMKSDPWINGACTVLGIVLLLGAIVPWLPGARRLAPLLFIPFAILVLDSLGRWVDANFTFGMAIEHALQMSMPLALWHALRHPDRTRTWIAGVLVASALTFVGHGLYAAGIPAVPLSYQTMTMAILGLGEEATRVFLAVAGWLDIAAAVLLVFAPTRVPALVYMAGWGALTALARIVAHAGPAEPRFGLDPWLAETLVRTPHWLLPLLALLVIRGMRSAPRGTAES